METDNQTFYHYDNHEWLSLILIKMLGYEPAPSLLLSPPLLLEPLLVLKRLRYVVSKS